MDKLFAAHMLLIDAVIDFIEAYQDAEDELDDCDDELFVGLMTDWYKKLTK